MSSVPLPPSAASGWGTRTASRALTPDEVLAVRAPCDPSRSVFQALAALEPPFLDTIQLVESSRGGVVMDAHGHEEVQAPTVGVGSVLCFPADPLFQWTESHWRDTAWHAFEVLSVTPSNLGDPAHPERFLLASCGWTSPPPPAGTCFTDATECRLILPFIPAQTVQP